MHRGRSDQDGAAGAAGALRKDLERMERRLDSLARQVSSQSKGFRMLAARVAELDAARAPVHPANGRESENAGEPIGENRSTPESDPGSGGASAPGRGVLGTSAGGS